MKNTPKNTALPLLDVPNIGSSHTRPFQVTLSYPGVNPATDALVAKLANEFRGWFSPLAYIGRQILGASFQTYVEALAFTDALPTLKNNLRFHSISYSAAENFEDEYTVQLDPSVQLLNREV